jgi:hypothetical protein
MKRINRLIAFTLVLLAGASILGFATSGVNASTADSYDESDSGQDESSANLAVAAGTVVTVAVLVIIGLFLYHRKRLDDLINIKYRKNY